MKNKTYIYIFMGLILLILFLVLPIKYSTSVVTKGKLLPVKTWTLSKGTDGRLITSLMDNSTGINDAFTVTQFERGDAVKFNLNMQVIKNNYVLQGDTIGYVISNKIEKEIEKLRGKLKVAKASLNVQISSEKKSVIAEQKNKLDFAKKQLDEQTKIYNRKKLLYEKQLISQQEYEEEEAKYELAKINISITEEKLRAVQSGVKEEKVSLETSRIEAIENEINILRKRFENNNIISPINGMVSRTFSSDTLLVVNDTSQYVVLTPISWTDIKNLNEGMEALISTNNLSETGEGKILSIGGSIKTIGGAQYVITTIISDSKLKGYKTGLYVDCEVDCGEVTGTELLMGYLNQFLN